MGQSDSWKRLKEIFEEAARLAPEERGRFVEERCAGDEELERSLLSLLRSHDSAAEFLASPTGTDARTSTAARLASEEGPGSLIGEYKLLQCIGEGGFGVVYMAEQQRPIVRKVALKVIKRGMDTKQVVARFEAERQALALMDHPNIAKVLDAGATEAGRPYFVMELVRGISITDYCDQNHLSNRERLNLFLPVCHAAEHAHQKGIIHRDLKPGNVLVTLHDGRPVPKIIDFGIAKATSMRLTERTLFTEFGVFIGTPEYMSPEQATLSGLDVDTRSDVYSLGAVLYELLTGRKPFDPARLRSEGYAEMQRVIREVDPAKPSRRVTELGAEGTLVAKQHGLAPRELARVLRGEPDWIVMKALSKDRTHRYASAGAFAADIEHHLRSEPVAAGPPGAAYRTRRFLRRHRAAVAVTGIVLLALVLGGALATVGFMRARRAEGIARREATRKGIEASALRASIRGDYSTYIARTRKAIELQREASRDKPEALTVYLADLLAFLGALEWIGEPRARPLRLEIETETLRRVVDSDTPADTSTLQILEPMIDYAKEYRSDFLVPLLRRAVAVRGRQPSQTPSLTEDRKRLARLLDEDAERLLASGRLAEARSLLMASVDRWEGIYPLFKGGEEGAYAEGLLGACLSDLGDYSAAEPLLLGAWRKLNSREQLVRVIELYRRWGKPSLARNYADQMVVDAVRDVGPLPAWPSVVSQSMARSGSVRGRTVWLFGGTVVREARDARLIPKANSWGWSTIRRDVRTEFTMHHAVESGGVPKPLLPLTVEEQASQAIDTTSSIDLSPGPVIEDRVRDRALVVYVKVVRRDLFVSETLGSSIAVWRDPRVTPTRPVVRAETAEPTLLFQGNEPRFAAGAVVVKDTLYLYATRQVWLTNEVLVARSPLAHALERGAWRFFAGNGEWSDDISRAAEVMLAGPHLSVHWNEYLGKYLAVTGQTLGDKIELRLADRPEGPWSRAHVIGTGLKPSHLGGWSCHALAHPALTREGGRVEYLTYRREVDDFSDEIRLMEITLHEKGHRASR